jgi:hypothetical protein
VKNHSFAPALYVLLKHLLAPSRVSLRISSLILGTILHLQDTRRVRLYIERGVYLGDLFIAASVVGCLEVEGQASW